jgi:hypothetical protein
MMWRLKDVKHFGAELTVQTSPERHQGFVTTYSGEKKWVTLSDEHYKLLRLLGKCNKKQM